MVTIKRVGLNSAFKVGAIVGLILAAVVGLLMVAMQGLVLSLLTGLSTVTMDSSGGFSGGGAEVFAAVSTASLCIFYLMYVIFSAIAGGITGVLWAFAYNLAARWVGGLELELAGEPGKSKRSYDFDDIYE